MAADRIELFLRWKINKSYEFKAGADKESVTFTEQKMEAMLGKLLLEPGGEKRVELMRILMEQARKDPEGRWVSANNDPIADGQVGGQAGGKA